MIDGNKVILSVSNPDTRVDDAEFEENEVYAVDIVASTGEGKVNFSSCFLISPVRICQLILSLKLPCAEIAAKTIG